MSTVKEIESAIVDLSAQEKVELRLWFDAHLGDDFDATLAHGVASGVFDSLIDDALAEHNEGKTRLL